MVDKKTIMEVVDVINKLKSTNSRNEKINIIKNPNISNNAKSLFLDILRYTYNGKLLYKIKKLPDIKTKIYGNIDVYDFFKRLDRLANSVGVSDVDKRSVAVTISMLENKYGKEFGDILKCVLLKDLKCGINVKTIIDGTWKGFIDEFKIKLASPEDKLSDVIKRYNKGWWNIKYNGIRAIISTANDGSITIYSRSGEILNLPVIEKKLIEVKLPINSTFDCEITSADDDVSTVMEVIFRQRLTDKHKKIMDSIKVNIFDVLTYNTASVKNKLLSDRIILLDKVKNIINKNDIINFVVYNKLPENFTVEDVKKIVDEVISNGGEGIIVKVNELYIEKRDLAWVKVKKQDTIDLEIVDIIEGKGRNKNKMGALVLKLDDKKTVKLGTGFKDNERIDIWNNKDKYIGRIAEIKYQELSKYGKPLQPRFVRFRDDKLEGDVVGNDSEDNNNEEQSIYC